MLRTRLVPLLDSDLSKFKGILSIIRRNQVTSTDFIEIARALSELIARTEGKDGSNLTLSDLREYLKDVRSGDANNLPLADSVAAYLTARNTGVSGPDMDHFLVDQARKYLGRRQASGVNLSQRKYLVPTQEDVDHLVRRVMGNTFVEPERTTFTSNLVKRFTHSK